ncbi:MAG TPA: NADP-dependent oxidoreductase [Puia sp.]|nr:NADP-dependent oxidoreductase [Puia sp.]
MKAIQIHEFGGPEVLKYEEAPRPTPAPDEILIKVYATGVNPVDWKIREGVRKEPATTRFPLIPGWDVSGVVEETGPGVENFKKGDEVYSRPDISKNGTYAEYVAVKADQVGRKPRSIDHVNAAGVPLAGLTAWQGLFDHGKLRAGEKVLILGASGGVGSFAVQFAKWKGAYVIATSSERNVDFLKKLGADEVLDYKKENFEEKLHDIDLVFDTVGAQTQARSIQVLKKGGRLITTVKPENEREAKDKNIRQEGYMTQSLPSELDEIANLIDSGKIKPVVSKVFQLDQAAEAQELSKEGHVRGKIVLRVINE